VAGGADLDYGKVHSVVAANAATKSLNIHKHHLHGEMKFRVRFLAIVAGFKDIAISLKPATKLSSYLI
jgi:hypothetical protein